MKKHYLLILFFLCAIVLSHSQTTLNFTIDTAVDNGTTITETIIDGPDTYVLTASSSNDAQLFDLGGGDQIFFTAVDSSLPPWVISFTKNGAPTTFTLNGLDYDTIQAGNISVENQDNNTIAASANYSGAGTITITNSSNAIDISSFKITPGDSDDLNDFGFHNINVTFPLPCTDPDIPTVTATPTSVCNGGSTTLNISGSLNDATQWVIYTGSCGGSQVGTTTSSTFVVTPSSPSTTYFVRGEDGAGCVDESIGACGQVTVTVTPDDDPSFSYSAASYCVNAADPTPTITGTTGGTFSSTAGLSINSSTGQIDVSASTPNTYTVTYTTAGACPNSSNVSVTINSLDDASFSYSALAYCVNAVDPTPTITGTTGGTFSSTAGLSINSSTGQIDVSASTPNTYTVTYTTAGACPNSSNVSVTINSLDDASFSYSALAYCVNAADPTPTITGTTGGTFSSTAGLSINSSTGQIDVSASTPNTYTVTYTTTGTCPNSSNVSVTINSVDDASFSYSAASYLITDADPTPTITGLTGGTFSSTAGLSISASTGTIDLSASTPNTYTVTYTTTGSCPNSSNVSVTIVDPAPTVSITSTESPGPTGADPIPVTITFSESVTGFELSDLVVGNGSAGNFTGSGTTYTADITPSGAGPLTITVDVNADAAIDSGGNGNTAASQFSIDFDNTLSIVDEILSNGLSIYPIPSSNRITIAGDTSLSLQKAELFDIQGKLILTQELSLNSSTHTIDISSVRAGLYLMTIYSETGSTTKRIVKE